jgi:hypothetical protein
MSNNKNSNNINDDKFIKYVKNGRKVQFGNLEFKSQKVAKEYVLELFENIGNCNSLKNIQDISLFNKVLDILKRHPQASVKLYNLKDITIENKGRFGFYVSLIYNDGNKDDISWKMCITGRENSDSLNIALRHTIDSQIKEYKNNNDTSYCDECKNKTGNDLHIDHVIQFKQLVNDFNKSRTDIPTEFDDAYDLPGRKIFKSLDSKYENEWKIYHRENAILRPLCRQCNLSRKKYKNTLEFNYE